MPGAGARLRQNHGLFWQEPQRKHLLKIVHVLLSRGFSGSERSTAESCNAQCGRHEVHLVLRRDHRRAGASVVDHLDPRVVVHTLPARLFSGWVLARLVRRLSPDVIHAHLRRSTRLTARLGTTAAKVSTLHIAFNGPHFHRMHGLICNARWQVESMPKDYGGLVFKARNSLTPHRRIDASERARLRAELGVAEHEFLFGGVGRLTDAKGWDTLVDAACRLPDQPPWRLIVFGEGHDEPKLVRQARGQPRIRFAGFRSDVKDLYQAFDALVCPSRFEPLPRVILEAMDAGTPVIASDAGGCRELLEDYGGDMFPVDDAAALAALMADHVRAPRARTRIDLGAHHVERANEAMEQFYRRAIAHAASRR